MPVRKDQRRAAEPDFRMAQTETSEPSLKDLMSYVGYLLLRWGQVESAMRSVVGRSRSLTMASRQGKALVEAWREIAETHASGDVRRCAEISRAATELEALRPLRNLVCHGIQSANSAPFAGRPAGLHCWLEDRETVVSWDDLDQAIRRLEGLAHIIR